MTALYSLLSLCLFIFLLFIFLKAQCEPKKYLLSSAFYSFLNNLNMKLALLFLSVFSSLSLAMELRHKDWILVCDNTLTCRAAGYQNEYEEGIASVLLTRKAGANELIDAKVQFQLEYDERLPNSIERPFMVSMSINNTPYGHIEIKDMDDGQQFGIIGQLSESQTNALTQSLTGSADIVFTHPASSVSWTLSDSGSYAVLLKMDDIQGRINTPSAIVKKGNATNTVASAKPKPIINKMPIKETTPTDKARFMEQRPAIIESIKASVSELGEAFYCPNIWQLDSQGSNEDELKISRLSSTKILVSTVCWYSAYNRGEGVWVLNNQAPFAPLPVEDSVSYSDVNHLYIEQKNRGLGDCWTFLEKVWNGNVFVESSVMNTGLCRGFIGGAWSLPSFVSEIH